MVKSFTRKRSPVRAPGLSVLEMTLSVRGDFTASSTHATVPPCLEAARASKRISCPILTLHKTHKSQRTPTQSSVDTCNDFFKLQIHSNRAHRNTTTMRGNEQQVKVHYQGKSDDFIILVDSADAVRDWKKDSSVPLAQVVSGWKIFVTHK